jgi:hypothetical protein
MSNVWYDEPNSPGARRRPHRRHGHRVTRPFWQGPGKVDEFPLWVKACAEEQGYNIEDVKGEALAYDLLLLARKGLIRPSRRRRPYRIRYT